MNKKLWSLVLVIILVFSVAVGCSSNNEAATNQEETATNQEETTSNDAKYEDGLYFASEDNFSEESGWKYTVILEVKDGMITSVDWSGVSINAGLNKKELSIAGGYPMVAVGKAQSEWHVQAELVEAFLLETQDPTAIQYQEDNYHTDAITGVSIGVSPMFKLAEKALAEGPKQMGPYKDGAYYAEQDEFDEKSGFKSTVDITVMFGNIVSVNWNAVHVDGGDDKKTRSINGEYGMVEKGNAQAPWFEQARLAENHLIETQDPTDIQYQADNYHTDAISGVSIGVSPMFSLAEIALKDAK